MLAIGTWSVSALTFTHSVEIKRSGNEPLPHLGHMVGIFNLSFLAPISKALTDLI